MDKINQTETIAGSEVLIRSLIAEGVDTIFGYPGGAIMPVFDALYGHKHEIRHILVRHEQGALHAAQGYARVSKKVGVALVTSGPGATNAITGITDAMMDSTPLVVISGQVNSTLLGSDAFQEADVIGVTQPITKWAYQIRRAEDIAWAVSRAFYIASSGRPGPVVLDIAKDAQVLKSDYSYQKTTFLRSYHPLPQVEEERIKMAADIINSAQKPFALVGQGVVLGNAEQELRAFLEKGGIPFGSTILGLSAQLTFGYIPYVVIAISIIKDIIQNDIVCIATIERVPSWPKRISKSFVRLLITASMDIHVMIAQNLKKRNAHFLYGFFIFRYNSMIVP